LLEATESCYVCETHLQRNERDKSIHEQTFDSFDSCPFIFFFFATFATCLLKVVNRAIPCLQVSRLDILAERERRDIGIVNHVEGQFMVRRTWQSACRSVPF